MASPTHSASDNDGSSCSPVCGTEQHTARRRQALSSVTGSHSISSTIPEFPPGQPLVFEVGKMGPIYWDWVNRPVTGQPRFFASTAAEHCTKTAWWVVPMLWLPIYSAASLATLAAYGLQPSALLCLQLLGIVLWQAVEYTIHRGIFHARTDSYWGITAHFLFHGCHHKFPTDGERLVFPPLPAAAIAAALFGGLRTLLTPPTAAGLMTGVLLGYVSYDCLHYAMHHASVGLPGALFAELRARHYHHHFHDPTHGYGISSVFFDTILGTSAALADTHGRANGGGPLGGTAGSGADNSKGHAAPGAVYALPSHAGAPACVLATSL